MKSLAVPPPSRHIAAAPDSPEVIVSMSVVTFATCSTKKGTFDQSNLNKIISKAMARAQVIVPSTSLRRFSFGDGRRSFAKLRRTRVKGLEMNSTYSRQVTGRRCLRSSEKSITLRASMVAEIEARNRSIGNSSGINQGDDAMSKAAPNGTPHVKAWRPTRSG
jgi:hypothetical protein